MAKWLVMMAAALGVVSAAVAAAAQEEMFQVEVGAPVTWTYEGTPVTTATGIAVIDQSPPLRFAPKEIDVAVGSTVIWTNRGLFDHTVLADDGSFDSTLADPLAAGETFTHVFTTAGEFPYKCEIHMNMKGLVRVA